MCICQLQFFIGYLPNLGHVILRRIRLYEPLTFLGSKFINKYSTINQKLQNVKIKNSQYRHPKFKVLIPVFKSPAIVILRIINSFKKRYSVNFGSRIRLSDYVSIYYILQKLKS